MIQLYLGFSDEPYSRKVTNLDCKALEVSGCAERRQGELAGKWKYVGFYLLLK